MELRQALVKVIQENELETQDDLVKALKKEGISVTQSTVSRMLRKVGVARTPDPGTERLVYRLLSDSAPSSLPTEGSGYSGLILSLIDNGSMIVIQTTPGSASLVARHLDINKPASVLGTLAGDDTIFVAPRSIKTMKECLKDLKKILDLEP